MNAMWVTAQVLGYQDPSLDHVRLRLQRQAIDTLGEALGLTDDDPNDPPAAAVVR